MKMRQLTFGRSEKKPADDGKKIRVMSMGAGVQTTAMLLMDPARYDYVIFADTGDEKKETYEYIEKYLKPFCRRNGVKWVTVRHKNRISLMEWCLMRKIVPIKTRRWCTADFKIRPINRFIKSLGATRKNPISTDIGISLDESHRANFSKDDVKYVIKEYPLLDRGITRERCKEIIAEHGLPVPPKSGCDFCMFQKRSAMKKLMADDPERFDEIAAMEKNKSDYPKYPLIGRYTLESLKGNASLDDYDDDESCDSGYCFR